MIAILVFSLLSFAQIESAHPHTRYMWMGDGHSVWSWRSLEVKRRTEKVSPEDNFRADYCMGYVEGILDSVKTLTKKEGKRLFCIPPNMPRYETIRELVRYLGEHPDKLGGQSGAVTVDALQASLPCK